MGKSNQINKTIATLFITILKVADIYYKIYIDTNSLGDCEEKQNLEKHSHLHIFSLF